MAKMRAAKVEEHRILVFRCPVCGVDVEGALTVEVHLQPTLVKTRMDVEGKMSPPMVSAQATARMRSLDVRHQCAKPTGVDDTDDGNTEV